ALIVVVALNVGGGDARNAATPAAAGASGATGAAASAEAAPGAIPFAGIETQRNVDYDDAGIQAVAGEAADAVVAAAEETKAPQAAFASTAQDSKERTSLARNCV